MTISSSAMTRFLMLAAGVVAVILPNVGSWGLPTSVQTIITAVGGTLLAVLGYLEHPTTKAGAGIPASPPSSTGGT